MGQSRVVTELICFNLGLKKEIFSIDAMIEKHKFEDEVRFRVHEVMKREADACEL